MPGSANGSNQTHLPCDPTKDENGFLNCCATPTMGESWSRIWPATSRFPKKRRGETSANLRPADWFRNFTGAQLCVIPVEKAHSERGWQKICGKKRAIARTAAAMFQTGDTLLVDTGHAATVAPRGAPESALGEPKAQRDEDAESDSNHRSRPISSVSRAHPDAAPVTELEMPHLSGRALISFHPPRGNGVTSKGAEPFACPLCQP